MIAYTPLSAPFFYLSCGRVLSGQPSPPDMATYVSITTALLLFTFFVTADVIKSRA